MVTIFSTELQTSFAKGLQWLSNFWPFRRNRHPSPIAPSTEQQPHRENDSLEHKAILSVTPQLIECLQRDPTYLLRLRDHLFAKEVISESNYVALDTARADELMKVVAELIEYSDKHFYKLINALELVRSEKWAKDILDILNSAQDTIKL